jgi:hypothetical protein
MQTKQAVQASANALQAAIEAFSAAWTQFREARESARLEAALADRKFAVEDLNGVLGPYRMQQLIEQAFKASGSWYAVSGQGAADTVYDTPIDGDLSGKVERILQNL